MGKGVALTVGHGVGCGVGWVVGSGLGPGGDAFVDGSMGTSVSSFSATVNFEPDDSSFRGDLGITKTMAMEKGLGDSAGLESAEWRA